MKIASFVSLLLLLVSSVSFALTSPFPATIADSDNDGIPDSVEEYLIAYLEGEIGLPDAVDDLGVSIASNVTNTYYDSDGDGIPDIIETWVTLTNTGIDDSDPAEYIGASGYVPNTGGTLTGQWEICNYSTSGSASDCNNVTNPGVSFETMSIMHASTGAMDAYMPDAGFLVDGQGGTVAYTAGTKQFVASFTGGGDTYDIVGTFDGTDTISGTTTVNAGDPAEEENNFIAKRISVFDGTEDVAGIYSHQETEFDPATGVLVTDYLNPTSFSFQQEVMATGSALVLYAQDKVPGYYVPSVGALGYPMYEMETGDFDGDGNVDDTEYIVADLGGLFLSEVSDGLPISFRMNFTEQEQTDFNSDGSIDDVYEFEIQTYGRNSVPHGSTSTYNRIAGPVSRVFLANVPLGAEQITLNGPPGSNLPLVVDDLMLANMVQFRMRLNPFTRGWDGVYKVGLSDTEQNVTQLAYGSQPGSSVTDLLPNGTYTFSFTDPGNHVDVNVDYTRPSTDADFLPVVNPTTVLWNGSPIFPGGPLTIDTTVDNTISWTSPATADKAKIIVREHGWSGPDNEIFFRFKTHTPGGVVSITIPAYSLESNTPYRIRIDEYDSSDHSNRSRTTSYTINDNGGQSALTGADPTGIPTDFNTYERLDTSSDIGFVLIHGRCAEPDIGPVSRLRRSLRRQGYNTISIQAPEPAAGCDPFSNYVDDATTGDNYVFPELYNRVNAAIDRLKSNGSKKVILIGHSMGSRMAAAYAAEGMTPAAADLLPVVGLVMVGNYGDYGSGAGTKLDSTTMLDDITVPVLDIYMDGDSKAVTTAANRLAAYGGSDYTQMEVPIVDSWSGLTTWNRHIFHGYERLLEDRVFGWVTGRTFEKRAMAIPGALLLLLDD